jgi:hypothetical protein
MIAKITRKWQIRPRTRALAMPSKGKKRAAARVQRVCCLGLGGPIDVPAVIENRIG